MRRAELNMDRTRAAAGAGCLNNYITSVNRTLYMGGAAVAADGAGGGGGGGGGGG